MFLCVYGNDAAVQDHALTLKSGRTETSVKLAVIQDTTS